MAEAQQQQLTQDELKGLMDRLLVNPEAAWELTDNEMSQVAKYAGMYGTIDGCEESHINLSIVNYRDIYFRRLHMTALIGFLFRLAKEYEPDHLVNSLQKQRADKLRGVTNPSERKKINTEYDELIAEVTREERLRVETFLRRHFKFNPDRHVLTAHTDNKEDLERVPKAELIRRKCELRDKATATERILGAGASGTEAQSARIDSVYKFLRDITLQNYQLALSAARCMEKYNELAALIPGETPLPQANTNPEYDFSSFGDFVPVLARNAHTMRGIAEKLETLAKPLAEVDTIEALEIDPPKDVFYHLERYITNHFEELQDIVHAVYHERPDIEFGIRYYTHFNTAEEAKLHRLQHNDEFPLSCFSIPNGATVLLGPFKQNLSRVEYYNKHTEVLRLMDEEAQREQKLGADLMKKGAARKKMQNIAEAGLDAKGLAEYSKVVNVVKELGAKPVLTDEEREELAKAVYEKEQLEVPEDKIRVDVFKPVEDKETGEVTSLAKDYFYTQAEAPLHLMKDSVYADKYQPVRGATDGEKKAKTIVSRKGEKRIVMPAADMPNNVGKCSTDAGPNTDTDAT